MRLLYLKCPHCGRQARAPDTLSGKEVRCGGCKKPFLVAAPNIVGEQAPKEEPAPARRTASAKSPAAKPAAPRTGSAVAPPPVPTAGKKPAAPAPGAPAGVLGRREAEDVTARARARQDASARALRIAAGLGMVGGVTGAAFVAYTVALVAGDDELRAGMRLSGYVAVFLEFWCKVLILLSAGMLARLRYEGGRLWRLTAACALALTVANVVWILVAGAPRFPEQTWGERPLKQLAAAFIYTEPLAPQVVVNAQGEAIPPARAKVAPMETAAYWAAVVVVVAFHATILWLVSRRSSTLVLERSIYARSRPTVS
ncbi:MAG: hypothetical protein HY719_12360 [Planctomycetes bacterium]|nr:hypothetical protein [Planctomycetota bacterium]